MATTTRAASSRHPMRAARLLLWPAMILQAACAAYFTYDIAVSVLGIRVTPIPWMAHELLEIGAALGLILGVAIAAVALRRAETRRRAAESRLAELSGAFQDIVDGRFDDWALTPAERDVALFVMKGCSTAEIAGLRQTSEGTVKAQTAAIYRKAGVSGRAQLVSSFIDDLLDGGLEGN